MNEENINIQEEKKCCGFNYKKMKHYHKGGSGGCLYGLGVIGAAVYFIQNAETFWMGVLGILKALVWPAIVVNKLLVFLYMWK